MPTILGANTLSSGYDVANSLRFNGGSSDRLNKTLGTPTNNLKFTYSFWIKRSKLGEEVAVTEAINNSQNKALILFRNDDQLEILDLQSDSYVLQKKTNRKFRDVSAWYHIVFSNDSTAGSPDLKLYVNGVEETSWATDNEYTQNQASLFNSALANHIGASASSRFINGYFSEFVFIDGQALDATSFGEFDEDSPTIWKPKSVSGLTFGDNGFYLEFKQNGTSQNSSGLGADTSGNDNHFAVNNLTAVDQSIDTCTNNYATFLGEGVMRSNSTFTNGLLKYNSPASNPVFGSLSTFGVEAGKWYAEVKYLTGSNHYLILGIADEVFATLDDLGSATNTDLGKNTAGPTDCTVAYVVNTGAYRNNNNNTSWGSGGGDGDIINIALDRDNRKVYFGVNGTYGNSSNPATGSNGIDISSLVTGDIYFLGVTNDTGSSETTAEFNFGAGATTAISSGNSDANGHGNFEYAVPSGYYAWNTKNLAEFG